MQKACSTSPTDSDLEEFERWQAITSSAPRNLSAFSVWRWRCDKPAANTRIAATTESGTTKTAIGGVVWVAKVFGVAVADDIGFDSALDGTVGRPNIPERDGKSVVVAGTLDVDICHPEGDRVGTEPCSDVGGELPILVPLPDWSDVADGVGPRLRPMELPDAEGTETCLTPMPRGCLSENMCPALPTA